MKIYKVEGVAAVMVAFPFSLEMEGNDPENLAELAKERAAAEAHRHAELIQADPERRKVVVQVSRVEEVDDLEPADAGDEDEGAE